MTWGRRFAALNRFVGAASSHISFWPWIFGILALIGTFAYTALAYLLAQATPLIAAFAPFSYFVALMVALLLFSLVVLTSIGIYRLVARQFSKTKGDTKNAEESDKNAPKKPWSNYTIDSLRRHASTIRNLLTNNDHYSAVKYQVAEHVRDLRVSESLIWVDITLENSRRNFLEKANIIISLEKSGHKIGDEYPKKIQELLDAWQDLEDHLLALRIS